MYLTYTTLHGKYFLRALLKQGNDLWDEDDRELTKKKKKIQTSEVEEVTWLSLTSVI